MVERLRYGNILAVRSARHLDSQGASSDEEPSSFKLVIAEERLAMY
jgi:hypothetical protein